MFTIKKIKLQQQEQLGFSLIELLVAVSIIVILTSLFLANFSGNAKRRDSNDAANNLISDLHALQSYALSSKDVTPGTPSSQYGLTLTAGTGTYTLLAYNNATPAVATVLGVVNLPSNIQINAISITKVSGAVVSVNADNILFRIPFAKVVQNFTGSTVNELNDVAKIKISSTDNSVCNYVIINGVTGNITSLVPCP